MQRLRKAWTWGVVVPVTVLALAGGLADVVTGTLQFWYLIWPSFPVIAVSVWGATSRGAIAAARRRRIAELDAEIPARRGIASHPTEPECAPEVDEDVGAALISEPKRVSVGALAGLLFEGFLRVLATLVITFICVLAIWAATAIATWGRGYWYVYGPVLALIAWLVWSVWRSGPVDAKDGEQADAHIVR